MATVADNLDCLKQTLEWNLKHQIHFFRITSDLIPFASHPVNQLDWSTIFGDQLTTIGEYVQKQTMRMTMHPDQFTLINSIDEEIFQRSVAELDYHATLLDALGLDASHKIQIHVGGVYGDKSASLERFEARYRQLPNTIQRRLVIENDERSYSLQDCLWLHQQVGVPIVFDVFHHSILNNDEPLSDAVSLAASTWQEQDGSIILDYSSQNPDKRSGSHAEAIDLTHFQDFIQQLPPIPVDIMLEIKDKQASLLAAHRAMSVISDGDVYHLTDD